MGYNTNVSFIITIIMDFTQFGLTAKEARFYNELLLKGPLTVRSLSTITEEQRTNCYLILGSLEKQKLVERNDLHAVIRFQAKDPNALRRILAKQQEEIRNVNNILTKSLPKLSALYKLTTERQGIAYFEDIEGYQAVHEDMLSADTVQSFISETIVRERPDTYAIVKKYVRRRANNGTLSYFLACPASVANIRNDHLVQKNVEVRTMDTDTFDGEITLYGKKIALTSYEKQRLNTLVITDVAQLRTFRAIFQTAWEQAKPI